MRTITGWGRFQAIGAAVRDAYSGRDVALSGRDVARREADRLNRRWLAMEQERPGSSLSWQPLELRAAD